jgi:hypothetical protein
MLISCGCDRKSKLNYQQYPKTGRLADNMNLDLKKLKERIIFGQAEVYCYVIATIKNSNGHFLQTGSAPNFQGDLISLCTCKHFMRTFMDTEDWEGKWIAGFSGVAAGNGNNVLVYIMKVGHAFKSQQSLWFSDEISEEAKQAKIAQVSQFGDIYEPLNEISDPFAILSYKNPVKNHVHAENNGWHKDINYEGCKGRKAALLVGDKDYSFLWDEPLIYYKESLHRGQKKSDLQTLIGEQLTGNRP